MFTRRKVDDLYITYSNPVELDTGVKHQFSRRFQERSVPCQIDCDSQSPSRNIIPFPKVPLPNCVNDDNLRNDQPNFATDCETGASLFNRKMDSFKTPRPPQGLHERHRRRFHSDVSNMGQQSGAHGSTGWPMGSPGRAPSTRRDSEDGASSSREFMNIAPRQASQKRRRCGVSSCNSNGNNSAVDRRFQGYSTAGEHTGQSMCNDRCRGASVVQPPAWPYKIGETHSAKSFKMDGTEAKVNDTANDIMYTKEELDLALKKRIHLPWMPVVQSGNITNNHEADWITLSHPKALAMHSIGQECMVPLEKKDLLMSNYVSDSMESQLGGLHQSQATTILHDTGRDLRSSLLERTHETVEALITQSLRRDRFMNEDFLRLKDSQNSRMMAYQTPYQHTRMDEEFQRYLDRSAQCLMDRGMESSNVAPMMSQRRLHNIGRLDLRCPDMLMTPIPMQPVCMSNTPRDFGHHDSNNSQANLYKGNLQYRFG